MVFRIGLVGCGTVGKGLIVLLNEKRDFLKERFGFEFKVCLLSDFIRGTLASSDGLDLSSVIKNLDEKGNMHDLPGVRTGAVPLSELLAATPVDMLCDATPTNYVTGQPSTGILEAGIASGASVVTCSKGGIGLDLARFKKLASDKGVSIRYECTVMSGTPLLNLVRSTIAGCSVSRVEGILNGTTNYILTQMESGGDYESALKEAQRLGFAETDPTGDVEGFDSAIKVCVLAQEFFGKHLRIDDVERQGITGVTVADIAAAKAEGKRIKLIAGVELTSDGVRGYVEPRAIDINSPLAGVMGVTNAACITTDNLGDIIIVGPGAGARETAQGLLADIIDISGCKAL